MKQTILFALCLVMLSACQPPPPRPAIPAEPAVPVTPEPQPTPQPPLPPLPPAWLVPLQQQAALLPAAVVTVNGEALRLVYPGESLFSTGSVLPLAGGAEVLDPLADLIAAAPASQWSATVRAATAHGKDYDAQLAAKRAELLSRYLKNRGVGESQIGWQSLAGDGEPLELVLKPVR